ncbi:MAG: alpha/beta hydrolase-fold protein [Opitutaceae bacterium]
MKTTTSLRIALAFGCTAPALLSSLSAADAATPVAPAPAAAAQPAAPPRPPAPVRLFDAPGSPKFIRLEGPGARPPIDAVGNYVVGPEYTPAPETKAVEGVPQGKVQQFVMESKDSKFYRQGLSRTQIDPATGAERDVFGTVDPTNPKTLIIKTHLVDFKRTITVYIPAQYVPGTPAPFIVTHDGPGEAREGAPRQELARVLDNLIAQKRVPVQIAIMIQNGGRDAQGNQRGLEYDTMSGKFAEFIEAEVLPLVEKNYGVTLTKDPEARATMGSSSGGSAALIMAWYRPDLYRRVITTSGTYVNQQWPFDPATPGGAWDFHDKLIPQSPKKPIRLWMGVGDRDLLNPNVMRDEMHDWVEANNRMAKVLTAKGYRYQYVFALNQGHGMGNARAQLLPQALEWVWKDYTPAPAAKR